VDFPIIGNGDVQTTEDVHAMLAETQCDLVMAGRALAARPWMMWQLGEDLGFAPPLGRENQKAPRTSLEEGAEYGRSLLQLLTHAREYFTEDLALRKIRFHIRTTAVWLPFGQAVVSASTKAKNISELELNLRELFSQELEMSARTELRQ
jgi:tRNA-dihydrouridine synthase